MGPPWIRVVGTAHFIYAQSDWGVRHLESHATPQTIPEQSSRCIIMIKEDTAIREHYFQVLCNILGRWYISKNCNIHRNARTQGFPAELCPEMASIIHSVRFQSSSYLFLCDLDQTCKPLHPTCISEPWMPMTLILVHCLSIHRTFLVGTNRWYCILGTAHKTCPSDCLAITFDLCWITQIYSLSYFSCFQCMRFKNWLFTCSLVYPITW